MNAFIPLLTACCLLAAALPSAAAEVKGGLKTGLNISDFVGSDSGNGGDAKVPGAGLAIGGFLVFPVSGVPFRVQTECLISVKGATYKGDVLGSHYESRMKLTYLEIPVLARFEIESRSGAKPAFLIGPYFGIKVSARSESHTVGYSNTGNIDNIKTFDPGVMLGGTVEIPAGRGAIALDARYGRSLATIVENSGGGSTDLKNSVITILLGYRF